ncbi:uncharacterized protein [Dysidea avara]|uniref:uncharacterized protein n=1 Tax=Dysidea avara TaxID=196820 RepID=UPI00332B412E
MMLLWMCLITLIITSQHVHSKVITINTNGGSDNTTCCVDGECDCSSLSTALTNITNNTVINITSESISLDDAVELGSSNLNNITIAGNGASILCNNNGSVYCDSCDNMLIEGITWDRCGIPGTVPAGLTIHNNANVSLLSCTFQNSQIRAVTLQNILGYVIVEKCNFLSNNNSSLSVGGGTGYNIDIVISDTIISGNQISYYSVVDIVSTGILCSLTLKNVSISNNAVYKDFRASLDSVSGVFSSRLQCDVTKIDMVHVIVDSNVCKYDEGSAVYIASNAANISINDSKFTNNTSVLGSVIYFDFKYASGEYATLYNTTITGCTFDNNLADHSNVYVDGHRVPALSVKVYLKGSNFSNNFGVSLFLTKCNLVLSGDILFVNNTANSGPALYLDMLSTAMIDDGANLLFVNNSAVSEGGAIFVELSHDCLQNYSIFSFSSDAEAEVSFVNNIAEDGPNAIYFSVFKYCNLIVNSSDTSSIMHVPYQFNYSQIINGTLTHVPTDYNYTWLNVTQFPVVTSPHQLKLYGDDIQLISNNTYFVGNKFFGRPVTFHGIVLDYFDKPAEVTRFRLTCIYCSSNWSLLNTFLSVDNVSPLNVILVGEEVVNNFNVILNLRSSVNSIYNLIDVILIVELVPCPVHPGYYYSDTSKGCVCYHHDMVECYEGYNEIKRGYWFGVVNGIVTTTLCPSQYCTFANRRKTRDGYCELPDTVDDQCEHHRTGTACGECSPGYTLAYDSSDCISIDYCSTGMTVLVVVLTCLYWIAVVVGVFILMYFNFQLSLGYLYGIVYYYSLTDILLNYNPYISTYAIQFVNIQSGFVQLTPQVLRQFCLAKGMTTIDQLFIHSFHAGAVLTLLLALVLVTRFSRKVSAFIRRCIIRILCLLLLLVYTSLSSTLLQTLRPLTYTGIKEVYTNSSPNIEYFRGRHMLYGIVALFCEVVVVIGVPMLLLVEKLLNRKVNLVKLKPILDQFKGCYKDKYRWFACYYMICRQVIMVQMMVLGTDESDYYSMLLQTTCVIIAAIHIWLQPYKNKFLNLFDGIILVLIVLIVNINTFDLPPSVTTDLVLVLVILPLVVLCAAGIIKKIKSLRRRRRHHYVAINEESDEDDDQNAMRNVQNDRNPYHQIQEPLLEVSAEVNN